MNLHSSSLGSRLPLSTSLFVGNGDASKNVEEFPLSVGSLQSLRPASLSTSMVWSTLNSKPWEGADMDENTWTGSDSCSSQILGATILDLGFRDSHVMDGQ